MSCLLIKQHNIATVFFNHKVLRQALSCAETKFIVTLFCLVQTTKRMFCFHLRLAVRALGHAI